MQLTEGIQKSTSFSIALDESIDITDVCHLINFGRTIWRWIFHQRNYWLNSSFHLMRKSQIFIMHLYLLSIHLMDIPTFLHSDWYYKMYGCNQQKVNLVVRRKCHQQPCPAMYPLFKEIQKLSKITSDSWS